MVLVCVLRRFLLNVVILIITVSAVLSHAQNDGNGSDSLSDTRLPIHPDYRQLIIPGALVTYGVLALTVKPFQQLNHSTKNEVLEDHLKGSHLDSYAMFVPAVAVYGLNALGVKGAHDLKDETFLLLTSQVISTAFVVPLKHLAKETRPDGAGNESWPSGHSATAFADAQFMFNEYKDTNIWIALSGYPFAVFTAAYRVINNRHWVGDVVAGAGFGMLSTELAYWIYPKLQSWFVSKKDDKTTTIILPTATNGHFGFAFIKTF